MVQDLRDRIAPASELRFLRSSPSKSHQNESDEVEFGDLINASLNPFTSQYISYCFRDSRGGLHGEN